MYPTSYKDVNEILENLKTGHVKILDKNLIGLYLEGALVIGDFDKDISDIDLVAVLSSDINNQEFDNLKKFHLDFVEKYPEWNDRIEVCYISKKALNNTKIQESEIVNISPGEPFHRTKTRKEWLMNWYLTRETGKTLFGQLPKNVIDHISEDEFIQSVKDHTRSWGEWIENMRNPYAQSYAILSICRALYAYRNGDQVSKIEAAKWAKGQLPEWSEVIQNALIWRTGGKYKPADETTHPQTVQFINHVRKLILAE
jgi:hypothetical protein